MSDWQDLELDEITEWPVVPQSVVVILLALILGAAGCWYWLIPLQDELADLKQTESELRTQVIRRASQVAALPTVRLQVEELKDRYQHVIEQLPEEKELASLLSGVNDIGIRNGLEFQRIEWAPRVEQPLYYELPINIALTGRYEDIGKFAAAVAKLSRIVTLNDFDLKLLEQSQPQETLSLKVSASTYRFKAPKSQIKGE
ncbi:type 4a pilus biogenesis protein PilO [Photobacterium sp. SDRW27]|uniref:type 4a pilus biogenesis protein PilO n=1 Tax=Photobacterium obscurum TaxID=2829490 RepID=UPI002243FBCB|nr:type 4a pilus biogenesis protein PilO [Photobacterium obscurum]MCW8329640.1 type 4a pilus biogenesis protein PilO [Photobacterium obscurum]